MFIAVFITYLGFKAYGHKVSLHRNKGNKSIRASLRKWLKVQFFYFSVYIHQNVQMGPCLRLMYNTIDNTCIVYCMSCIAIDGLKGQKKCRLMYLLPSKYGT